MTAFWTSHSEKLNRAIEATQKRDYWSAYPEAPSGKIYGETAKADAEAAFETLLDKPFSFDKTHPAARQLGAEISPYGRKLGVTYPSADIDTLVSAAKKAGEPWGRASVEDRAGVCVEILERINRQSFLIANAVMHTSGQAFMMAFQAGGPHAQDRALEAVAYAVAEMQRVPQSVRWEKPQGKGDPIRLDKQFRIVPRGVALVIGCATFPTWNGYPGLFASLATGNAVIVKPHPGAILPLAITIKIARDVIAEAGFDPNVIVLAADEAGAPITQQLAQHGDIEIIDFTGGPVFGKWLRENTQGKELYTEEAGLNSIIIDSTKAFTPMCDNIAFSLSLYSGQMCTAPQNIFVPKTGIETEAGHKSFDEVAKGIADAADRLLSDPARAAGVLGAIQSEATAQRIVEVRKLGKVVRESGAIESMSGARSATPLILSVDATDEKVYLAERFGPISFVIATASTDDSLKRAAKSAHEHGAITAAIYSTNETILTQAEDAFSKSAVALSSNLIGGIFVNQSSAFSDFHVSGGNPAGNACLTDAAFVASRFRVAPSRRMAA